jgi:tetratricopeptide (TPR) repeat protein
LGKPLYNQHNRREGFAISDLNRYLEMISQISSIASTDDADANYCLSEMHYNVALIYEELKDFDGAVSSYNSSLLYAGRLINCEIAPLYYETTSALIYGQLALAERRRGQPAKAITYYNKSISIYASLIHNDPTNDEYLQCYAQVLSNAGIAHRYSGDIVKALQCYDQAIQLYK